MKLKLKLTYNVATDNLILVINQLDAQNFCFTVSSFRSLYMLRAHVLIIRKPKLHYTASGIITPTGGRLVHRLREDWLCIKLVNY